MSFNKEWCNYVLHNIDSEKLDQMIIDLKCQLIGCRKNNRKGMKSIPAAVKIGALSRHLFIEKEVRKELDKFYEDLLKQEEFQTYLNMTPTEFIAQLETFKEKEEKEVQLAVVNYFLQAQTTLDTEKEKIVSYFNVVKKESNKQQTVVPMAKPPVKREVAEQPAEGNEQFSKKDAKNLKILQHLYDEMKEKEEKNEEKIKQLTQQLQHASEASKCQEAAYQQQVKTLKHNIEQLTQDNSQLKLEKEALEEKLKQTSAGKPYVLIGSSFIKQKLDNIKDKHYPDVNVVYLSTKQWENGLGRTMDEVAEVYAFFYDMEWLMREKLYDQYQEKMKIFRTDDLFHEYIEQHWEA